MAKYIIKGTIIYRKFLWMEWRVGRVKKGRARLDSGKQFPRGRNEFSYETMVPRRRGKKACQHK